MDAGLQKLYGKKLHLLRMGGELEGGGVFPGGGALPKLRSAGNVHRQLTFWIAFDSRHTLSVCCQTYQPAPGALDSGPW